MSTAPKNLHNFALPDLKWAHKNTSSPPCHQSKLSDPSSQPDSDEPIQKPVAENEAGGSSAKPRTLRPRKPQAPPNVSKQDGLHKHERREKKNQKLRISLTKEEIEEDLYSMTGARPTRKPKRRPKNVQKVLDNLFPGLSLDGISPDSYKKELDRIDNM